MPSKRGSAEIVSIIVRIRASKTYPEGCDDHPDNFLLRSALSNIDKEGYNIEASATTVSMESYCGKDIPYFWIWSATSCSNVRSHRQKPTW